MSLTTMKEAMHQGLKPEPQATAASDCYALGDKVRLLKNIWEGEIDGLIPAHELARKGEILIVRRFGGWGKTSMGVSHENRPDDYSIVTTDEVEKFSTLDNCCVCGKDIRGLVRVENEKAGYSRCLKCGLGVSKSIGA
jgi:hypothetical protein